MSWYYVSDNKSVGPIELSELRRLLADKQISASDLVWNETMGSNWAKASDCPELKDIFVEKPKPPAPVEAPAPVEKPKPQALAAKPVSPAPAQAAKPAAPTANPVSPAPAEQPKPAASFLKVKSVASAADPLSGPPVEHAQPSDAAQQPGQHGKLKVSATHGAQVTLETEETAPMARLMPPEPAPVPKKPKKVFKAVLLLILAIAVLAVTAWLLKKHGAL